MECSKLEQGNVSISKITFGAWAIGGWLWGGNDDKDAIKAIDAAIEHGVSSIDTAPIYGFGHSEQLVGKAIKGKRDQVQILTKYGMRWDLEDGDFYFNSTMNDGKETAIYKISSKKSIIYECEQSLKRLGTDYIDLYQAHWPESTTPIEETMEALDQLIKEGKVLASGVCNYTKEQLDAAHRILPQATQQVPYSMVLRGIEDEIVPYCQKNGIGILAYSPLQRGLLTGKITENYEFGEGDHRPHMPHFKPENLRKTNAMLDEIKPIAEAHDVTLAQLVLNWTAQQPGITAVLAGARNAKQMTENAASLHFKLSQEEMEKISQALDKLQLDV
jgi:aryl-alcohol dehydrogenase-like predicted oxidoreductase